MAVWPPDKVVEDLTGLARPPVDGLRWTDRRQWHVTLRFLGPADVEDARLALDTVTFPVGVVDAVVGPEVGRFGRRVLHVPVTGLDGLAAAVVSATAEVGEPPEDRPFSGHLTLARVAKGTHVDLGRLTGQVVSGRWPVTEVTLVESRLSSAGASYEVLARRPLPG